MHILFFLILGLFTTPLTAQIIYNSSRGEAGYLTINPDSSIILEPFFIGRSPFGNFSLDMNDIALHPNGQLYIITRNKFIAKLDTKMQEVTIIDSFPSHRPITGLEFDKDGTLYGAGLKIHKYDLNSKKFISENCFVRCAGDIIFYEGRYLLSNTTSQLIELDRDKVCPSILVFDHSHIANNFLALTFTQQGIYGFTPGKIYEIDLEKDTVYFIGDVPPSTLKRGNSIYGLTSEEQFRTNYQMYLDLDHDNSGGRFINHYQSDTFCVSQLPIMDTDARLSSKIGIDSIVFTIETETIYPEEKLTISNLPTVFTVRQETNKKIVLYKANTNQPGGFLNAIKQIRYDVSKVSPFKEERVVALKMYSGNQVSDVAKAFLNIDLLRTPYAGEDIAMKICPNQNQFNPLLELGESVDTDGKWKPELHHQVNDNFIAYFQEAGTYQYITQTGACLADTAKLDLTYFAVDSFSNDGQVIQFLSPGDSLILDVTIPTGKEYFWQDQPADSVLVVTEPGLYEFAIFDENNCRQGGYYAVQLSEEIPIIQTTTSLDFCGKQTYIKNGITYTSDTLLCETFTSTLGRDSTHCQQLLFSQTPLTTLAATICAGETYNLLGQELGHSGTFNAITQRSGQCDSLIDLTLTVLPLKETHLDTIIKPGEIITIGEFTFEEAGTYFIHLNGEQGCDSLVQLTVDFSTATVEIATAALKATLFPNPTTNTWSQLQMETNEKKEGKISILDYTGKQLSQQDFAVPSGLSRTRIDLPMLSGIYWVQLLVEGGQQRYFRLVRF